LINRARLGCMWIMAKNPQISLTISKPFCNA
jgi:hypothetical protein